MTMLAITCASLDGAQQTIAYPFLRSTSVNKTLEYKLHVQRRSVFIYVLSFESCSIVIALAGAMVDGALCSGQPMFASICEAALLWEVLSKKAVEVFVHASLSTAVRFCEVGFYLQGLCHTSVLRPLQGVAESQRLCDVPERKSTTMIASAINPESLEGAQQTDALPLWCPTSIIKTSL